MSVAPLRRQVLVACDPEIAYRVFLDEIGSWWPVASHGCFGEGSAVAFDGERIVETAPDGRTAVWGTVVESAAPREVSFTWHPGRGPEDATRVRLTFVPAGEAATLVTLVHAGWEARADADRIRGESAGGWVTVLARYADAPAVAGDAPGERWFVLEHTAGPATPPEGVFASPDFPKHIAFLRELQARGQLVAGGPLPDDPGSGMTIARVPHAAAARELILAAQHDDGAVAAGLLEVRVRPWRVALAAA
ncbi:SRPBCC domain-containing protein [Microbacterium rhizophilus]|uniref:SRPBCC domain-containing protein n=1 Tax=Microbacterium rhizophilus TaxID=3138934 RepID=UPI0031EFF9DC